MYTKLIKNVISKHLLLQWYLEFNSTLNIARLWNCSQNKAIFPMNIQPHRMFLVWTKKNLRLFRLFTDCLIQVSFYVTSWYYGNELLNNYNVRPVATFSGWFCPKTLQLIHLVPVFKTHVFSCCSYSHLESWTPLQLTITICYSTDHNRFLDAEVMVLVS